VISSAIEQAQGRAVRLARLSICRANHLQRSTTIAAETGRQITAYTFRKLHFS
jgi:hypothetical protein